MSDDHIMNKPGGEELSADENMNGGDGSGAGSAPGAADSGTDAGLMSDDADVAADGIHSQMPDVVSIDEDGAIALLKLVEIGQQMAQGGLAAAGGTHQSQFPAFFQA